jgi:hypothetical protein
MTDLSNKTADSFKSGDEVKGGFDTAELTQAGETLARLGLVSLAVALLSGCSIESSPSSPPPPESPKQLNISETKSYGSEEERWSEHLITVEHDGHLFVIHNKGYGSSMLHHPGCECATEALEIDHD